MYVLEEKKVSFIAHPRTASVALGFTLEGMGFTQIEGHHRYTPNWCLEHTFSVVRNPFDLLVSWFLFKSKPADMTFKWWLNNLMVTPCPNHYIRDAMFFGRDFSTDILHFENLQEEFDVFTEKVGLPQARIYPRNVTQRKADIDFREFYTPDLIDLVVNRFGSEIFNNGYESL